MIYFTITRMWLYHGKLSKKALKSFDDLLEVTGTVIQKFPSPFFDQPTKGELLVKWRELTEDQKKGHDLFPALDLDADKDLLKELNTAFIEDTDGIDLTKFRLRITDYGYLNVLLIYQARDLVALQKLKDKLTTIVRRLNRWIPKVDTVLKGLEKMKLIEIRNDFFGVPLKLKNALTIDHTDTYTYENPIFLTEESIHYLKEISRMFVVDNSETDFGAFKVYGIDQTPIWCFDKKIYELDITDYVEPQNLILAERTAYDGASTIYFSIIELMEVSEEEKNQNLLTKVSSEAKAYSHFTATDLRKLILRFGSILHQVNLRTTAIEPWQDEYLRTYKKKYPFDDQKSIFKNAEILLSKLIEEKTQQSERKHSSTIELFILFLTSITVYSVYIDIVSFFETKHNNFAFADFKTTEMRLIVAISILLILVLVYFKRKMRR